MFHFLVLFFFFNDTATPEIYTLSLHDALPISEDRGGGLLELAREALVGAEARRDVLADEPVRRAAAAGPDRKSTRLNSSHGYISYAVFCLKKKNIANQ